MRPGIKSRGFRLAVLSATAAWAVLFGDQAKAGYGIEFSPSVALGDTLGGTFAQTYDWSVYAGTDWEFGVVMSLQGSNPNLPFDVAFYDTSLASFVAYQGSTVGMLASNTFLPITLNPDQLVFNFSDVGGLQFTWSGGGAIATYLTYAAARNTDTASMVNLAPLWSGSFTVDPDATTATYTQTAPPEPAPSGFFVARAPGGVRFLTSSSNTGAELPAGATAWAPLSDRNAKTGITAIDPHTVLHKLAALPVTAWQYKHDPKRRYIGPMAQDFHATFGLGSDDKHLSTLDTDGVALAALQGLISELQERQVRSAAQAQRLADLEAELQALREQVGSNLSPAE